MSYVTVPKDLKAVKTKVALGLTARQIACLGASAAIGIPLFLLTKGAIGSTAAMMLMVAVMAPGFAFAVYERDGMPLETVLSNFLDVRYRKPGKRFRSLGSPADGEGAEDA